jgi:hypothetical protein
MAVGLPLKTTYANGDVYSASDVNDTNGTVNLVGQTNNFYSGKNKIINGNLAVNQRNFSSSTTNGAYGFDRFQFVYDTGTVTYSAQTFTPGTAPVAGYEAKNFARVATSGQSATNAYTYFGQWVEDVRTFAGQTVTYSFWAKASSGTPSIGVAFEQYFGTGGSPSAVVITRATATQTITTSWARYSFTVAIPSISGKTVGTTTPGALNTQIWTSAGTVLSGLGYPAVGTQNATIDFWGMQLEAGSTATAFQTATGTIQGELAACQRYCFVKSTATQSLGLGTWYNSTIFRVPTWFPVQMRVAPSITSTTGTNYYSIIGVGASTGYTTLGVADIDVNQTTMSITTATGTGGQSAWVIINSGGSITFNSEL